MNFLPGMSRLSEVIFWQTNRLTYRHADRQTGQKLYTTPLRGWSMKLKPGLVAVYDIQPGSMSGAFLTTPRPEPGMGL